MKSKFVTVFLVLVYISAWSQQAVEVSYEYDQTKETYIFTVNNKTPYHQVVVIDGSFQALTASQSIPAVIDLRPRASNRSFTLKKSGIGTPRFSYSYRYFLGCSDPFPTEVTYAIPLAQGKTTTLKRLVEIGDYVGAKQSPLHFNAVSFTAQAGDTVFSSRRGIVVETNDDQEDRTENQIYARELNFVRIQHDDCTIGSYTNFERAGIFVEEGDFVEVGTPLGIVNSVPLNEEIQIRQSFYYFKIQDFVNSKEDKMSPHYFPIKYQIEAGASEELVNNRSYVVYKDETLITQEMSKREIKKWREKQE